ncbi:MAG: DNA-directed RNA polymerase subunit delta [Spiroplasma sp.]|nr:DNA-directed RNA polymerase subunit delta [Mycoplasmatales bacterium]
MKNIVDLTIELLNKNKEGVSNAQIIAGIENPQLISKKNTKRIEALIYNDLLTDGRFIELENTWDLKDKYTIKEVLKEQYRSFSNLDLAKIVDEDEEEFSEEIKMTVSLDDNDYKDDAVAMNDLEEIDGKK